MYSPPGYGPPPHVYGPPPMGPPGGFGGYPPDPRLVELARKDPNNVFLIELLCTGILNLPGIGQIMIGDVGLGVALLVCYPIVVVGLWSVLILVTCGIGGFLVFLQMPINFLVGYLLANRAKQKILEARRILGMPY
jgi:hypothetical protein